LEKDLKKTKNKWTISISREKQYIALEENLSNFLYIFRKLTRKLANNQRTPQPH